MATKRLRFLCLAYGAEKDWLALDESTRQKLLEQDEVVRKLGNTVGAVQNSVAVVRAWDGVPNVTSGPFAASAVPLAGFGIIEADSLEDVVKLVAGTPCAVARGAIEIRQIL